MNFDELLKKASYFCKTAEESPDNTYDWGYLFESTLRKFLDKLSLDPNFIQRFGEHPLSVETDLINEGPKQKVLIKVNVSSSEDYEGLHDKLSEIIDYAVDKFNAKTEQIQIGKFDYIIRLI